MLSRVSLFSFQDEDHDLTAAETEGMVMTECAVQHFIEKLPRVKDHYEYYISMLLNLKD